MHSDNLLVEKCLSGDRSAFRELIERHQNRVYSLAFRMLQNRTEAEDIAQDAFVRAFSSLPKFRAVDEHSFARWICRITTNLCLNAVRDGKHSIAIDPVDLERMDKFSVCSQEDTGRQEAVTQALQSLAEDYRVAVVLRYMEDLSYKEISEVLAVPVSTVETRLYRAKKKLKELLKEWF